MNILLISHLFPRPNHPSKGVFVQRQAEALSDRGHSVTVISPVPYIPPIAARLFGRDSSSNIPNSDCFGDVTVHYPRFLSLPGRDTLALVAHSVKRTVGRFRDFFERADIINAHVAVPDGFAAAQIAEASAVPMVTTIHGGDLQKSIHLPLVEPQIKRAVTASSLIILNSYKTLQLFEEEFGTDYRTEVIHNGVPLELVRDAQPRTVDDTTFRVISVGNLTEAKGQQYVLEALAELSGDIEYVVVGDGPLRGRLEQTVRELGLEDAVTFTGMVPHEDVFSYLEAADAFVLPSSPEAFGVAYVEAMASGLPVVACEGEGPADYVTHRETGFLVPPREPGAIASVIREMRGSPDLVDRIASRGQRVALNAFTWDRNAELVEQAYKDAISVFESG